MKIIPNSPSIRYKGKSAINKGFSASDTKKAQKNFDEIVISKKELVPEGKFISELKNRVLKEVSSPTSEKKLEELRFQIENGSYENGLDEVMRRMLLS